MATDPFASIVDSIGEPYAHAFEIEPEALLAGDIDLPAVSSAVRLPNDCRVKVTMQGGQTVSLINGAGYVILPLRIVKVHQLADPMSGIQWPETYLERPMLVLW